MRTEMGSKVEKKRLSVGLVIFKWWWFNCDVQRRLRWNLSNRMRLHSPHSRFGCCRGSCRRCWWSSRGCGVFLSTTVVSNRGFLLLLSATKVLSNAVICNHHFRFPRVLGFWKAQKNLLSSGGLNFVSSTTLVKLRARAKRGFISFNNLQRKLQAYEFVQLCLRKPRKWQGAQFGFFVGRPSFFNSVERFIRNNPSRSVNLIRINLRLWGSKLLEEMSNQVVTLGSFRIEG